MLIQSMDDVNFDCLRNSNCLGHKWAKHFDVSGNRHMSFIIDLKKHPHIYLNRLESLERGEILEDMKEMYYASEVEDFLVSQFYFSILSVLKRFKINKNRYDEFLSQGMLAIRSAVWTYRQNSIKFSNYVYNGIYQRVLGILSREARQKKKNKRKKIEVLNASDLNHDSRFNDVLNNVSKSDDVYNYTDESELDLDNIANRASLNQQEIDLLKFFMMKQDGIHGWNRMYRSHLVKEHGVIMSKQGVVSKLKSVQKKVLNVVREIKGQDFINSYALEN